MGSVRIVEAPRWGGGGGGEGLRGEGGGHTPSIAFRHLPPEKKDVVNKCLEVGVCMCVCVCVCVCVVGGGGGGVAVFFMLSVVKLTVQPFVILSKSTEFVESEERERKRERGGGREREKREREREAYVFFKCWI